MNRAWEFYACGANLLIAVPVSLFRFYVSGLPNYMNFGGIGKVIGHEIAHGFDNDGGRYDKVFTISDLFMFEVILRMYEANR